MNIQHHHDICYNTKDFSKKNVITNVDVHPRITKEDYFTHFTYSIITNIDQDHIEYHKSLENYINSKLKIMNNAQYHYKP